MPGSVSWRTSKGDVDLGAHACYCSCTPSEIPLAKVSLRETEFRVSATQEEFCVRRRALHTVANKQTSCLIIVRLQVLWWLPLFIIEEQYNKREALQNIGGVFVRMLRQCQVGQPCASWRQVDISQAQTTTSQLTPGGDSSDPYT